MQVIEQRGCLLRRHSKSQIMVLQVMNIYCMHTAPADCQHGPDGFIVKQILGTVPLLLRNRIMLMP